MKCQDTSLSCMPTAGTAQGSVSAITPRHADSCALIRELCKWFAIYGVPQEISTYGGQPYTSHEVQVFLTTWGISHRLSSAYYPQSNGRAQSCITTLVGRHHCDISGNAVLTLVTSAGTFYLTDCTPHLAVRP